MYPYFSFSDITKHHNTFTVFKMYLKIFCYYYVDIIVIAGICKNSFYDHFYESYLPTKSYFCQFVNISTHLSFHEYSKLHLEVNNTLLYKYLLIFVGIRVTFACDDIIFYVILRKKDASHLENYQIANDLHAGLHSFCNLIKLMLNA